MVARGSEARTYVTRAVGWEAGWPSGLRCLSREQGDPLSQGHTPFPARNSHPRR